MCGYIWGTGHFYVWVLSMYVGNIGDIGGTCVWVYVANKAYMCVGTLETGSRYLTHTQHIITGVRCDLDSTSTDQERAFVYFRVTLQPVDLMWSDKQTNTGMRPPSDRTYYLSWLNHSAILALESIKCFIFSRYWSWNCKYYSRMTSLRTVVIAMDGSAHSEYAFECKYFCIGT